jgi:hypothetical protein
LNFPIAGNPLLSYRNPQVTSVVAILSGTERLYGTKDDILKVTGQDLGAPGAALSGSLVQLASEMKMGFPPNSVDLQYLPERSDFFSDPQVVYFAVPDGSGSKYRFQLGIGNNTALSTFYNATFAYSAPVLFHMFTNGEDATAHIRNVSTAGGERFYLYATVSTLLMILYILARICSLL